MKRLKKKPYDQSTVHHRQHTKSSELGVQVFFNRIFSVLFLYVLCVYLCKYTMYVDICGISERLWDPLELELLQL